MASNRSNDQASEPDVESSTEYETMTNLCPHLVSLVKKAPNEICDAMLAKGWISNYERDYVRMSTHTPAYKARKLVDTMTDRVHQNPANFCDFIKLLESQELWTADEMKLLRESRSKLRSRHCSHREQSPTSQTRGIDGQTGATIAGRLELDAIMGIDMDFNDMVSNLRKSLESQQVDHRKIAKDIILLRTFPKQVQSDTDVSELFCQQKEDLLSAGSIGDIIRLIVPYVSFFNFSIIESIVRSHGSDTDKEKFQQYLEKFEKFCRQTTKDCQAQLIKFSNVDRKDPHFTTFKVKIDSDIETTYTVKAVELFRSKLCTILGVAKECLQLDSVQDGCILLTFLIPNFVVRFVFPLTQEQERTLFAEGVSKYALSDDVFHTISVTESDACVREKIVTVKLDCPNALKVHMYDHTRSQDDLLQKKVDGKVREKKAKLEVAFVDLLIKARKAIQNHPDYDLDKVLVFSSEFSTTRDNIATSLYEKLKKCNNIVTLFTLFDELGIWDFLHYKHLSRLIKRFCPENKKLCKNMKAYSEKVKQFTMETKLSDFLDVWSSQGATHSSAPKSGCVRLKLKWKATYATFTLVDLVQVRQNLCSQFKLKEYVLRFEHAKPGPVEIYWNIPVEAANQIVDISEKHQSTIVFHESLLGLAVGDTILMKS